MADLARPAAAARECPGGCGRTIDPAQVVVCRWHWARLPAQIRARYQLAYRIWRRLRRDRHRRAAAADELRAATAAVIAASRGGG